MGPLLAIFPHPDDETFTAGGVMAAAIERGIPVTLLCATRGEAGESSIPSLDDPDKLGAVREQELREAMLHLGVTDVRFLGYRDSGMEGSSEADHERAFVRVPVEDVAAGLASLIRDIRPTAILTYGPDGIYGHPDHLHLHHATVRAVILAADPAFAGPPADVWRTPGLYFGTAPREEMQAMLEREGSPLESISETARANLGTPTADITHVIDTTRWADGKGAAFAAHRTQTGEGGPINNIPPDVLEQRLGREYFVRAALPWSAQIAEPDLLDELAVEQASR